MTSPFKFWSNWRCWKFWRCWQCWQWWKYWQCWQCWQFRQCSKLWQCWQCWWRYGGKRQISKPVAGCTKSPLLHPFFGPRLPAGFASFLYLSQLPTCISVFFAFPAFLYFHKIFYLVFSSDIIASPRTYQGAVTDWWQILSSDQAWSNYSWK